MPIVRSFSIVACGLTAQPLLQPSPGSYQRISRSSARLDRLLTVSTMLSAIYFRLL
jgi:hypothetical protein